MKKCLAIGFILILLTATAFSQQQQHPLLPDNSKDHFHKLQMDIKPEYFLGEKIEVKITALDKKGKLIQDGKWRRPKFFGEMHGIFTDDHGRITTRKFTYDVTFQPTIHQKTDYGYEWVTYPPDTKWLTENTMSLDLESAFSSLCGVGEYKFTLKTEHGYKISRKFRISYNPERSFPALKQMLISEDMGHQNWAFYHLGKYDRARFKAYLEELKLSSDARLKKIAGRFLSGLNSNPQL